jgi:hypothetical protein
MTDRYFDTNGQAHDPELISTPEAGGELPADVGAGLDALRAEGIRHAERFYDYAPPEYWRDVDVVKMYVRMAQRFAANGRQNDARIYYAIARSVADVVTTQLTRINARIKEEMNDVN